MRLALVAGALAHPSADERFDSRIAELPPEGCVAGVWLERARALGEEGRRDEALGAVDAAAGCGAGPVELALARGLLLAESRPAEALAHLDAFLRVQPGHAGASSARAEVRRALGDRAGAVADLRAALAASAAPSPDDVLRLARLLAEQGDPEAALGVIDEAPASPALVEEAVALELALDRPEAALGRLDAMPLTPHWLALRARVEP